MNKALLLPFVVLLTSACRTSGADDAPAGDSGSDDGSASLSGDVGGLALAPSANATAGTFWGADDGLHVLITDARDPCAGLKEGRRQPNTSVLVLQFFDTPGEVNPPTEASAGDYPGDARWFRVVRAFHLDDSCAPTVVNGVESATGSGALDDTVSFSGGTAVGSFSASFADGSLTGTFSAPVCDLPVATDCGPGCVTRPRCDYFSTISDPGCLCE